MRKRTLAALVAALSLTIGAPSVALAHHHRDHPDKARKHKDHADKPKPKDQADKPKPKDQPDKPKTSHHGEGGSSAQHHGEGKSKGGD
ncbi:MAG TPA: hypothetical protein VGY97_07005 [Solirubrobacteraceae bacterium]|nr:hypothetical protein [Solirubrobacteraceae bacterium]